MARTLTPTPNQARGSWPRRAFPRTSTKPWPASRTPRGVIRSGTLASSRGDPRDGGTVARRRARRAALCWWPEHAHVPPARSAARLYVHSTFFTLTIYSVRPPRVRGQGCVSKEKLNGTNTLPFPDGPVLAPLPQSRRPHALALVGSDAARLHADWIAAARRRHASQAAPHRAVLRRACAGQREVEASRQSQGAERWRQGVAQGLWRSTAASSSAAAAAAACSSSGGEWR